jgi:hypothetical protein
LVLGVTGWAIALLVNVPKSGEFKLRSGGLTAKMAFACIVGGGFALGVSAVTIIAAALWWCLAVLFGGATPGKLALISVTLGLVPLLLTAVASAIAALLGCTVDVGGARNCHFLGINFGPLIHTLFMAYWLVFLTAGLAVVGLVGSGIWAIARLF